MPDKRGYRTVLKLRRGEESGQCRKGLPRRGAPCGAQSKGLRPNNFRYIGLHRLNVVKKESLVWFSNQAVLRSTVKLFAQGSSLSVSQREKRDRASGNRTQA
jgi:hypothetical protein